MKTEKKIEDFLHLYWGCDVMHPALKNKRTLKDAWGGQMLDGNIQLKPILRPLSSMTEEEQHEMSKMVDLVDAEDGENYWWGTQVAAHRTNYLISKHFDLFNLIPDGLAIDSSTINSTPCEPKK